MLTYHNLILDSWQDLAPRFQGISTDDHQTFPRLPFEPIDKNTYQDMMVGVMMRRVSSDFDELLAIYDQGVGDDGSSAAGCDSDKCLMP